MEPLSRFSLGIVDNLNGTMNMNFYGAGGFSSSSSINFYSLASRSGGANCIIRA